MSYVSRDEFRAALSRWCTGVSVVTVRDGEENHGMTVSAFASVSLTPPTILVCLDTRSRTAAIIERRGAFAVNILSAGQSEVSERFAGRDGIANRFTNVPHRAGTGGLPIIDDAVATLECDVTDEVKKSDHTIFIATVSKIHGCGEIDPLLYFRGDYQGMVYGRRTRPR
jgi:3-hydroxy-9,10-secoandrosta-1,3,5(10)-triene-9,17-dione monooxygenase reductase component